MMLNRSLFLVLSSAVALAVGTFAFAFPHALLQSKGVAPPNDAAAIWVREVGVTIFALGVMLLLVRKHADSPTLRAFFFGNGIVHLGLLPIEIGAYRARVITQLSGIVPNSVLHVALALGFLVFAARMREPAADRDPP
jgi:uncharacterized membrane protein